MKCEIEFLAVGAGSKPGDAPRASKGVGKLGCGGKIWLDWSTHSD
jgi:hypothetical protein